LIIGLIDLNLKQQFYSKELSVEWMLNVLHGTINAKKEPLFLSLGQLIDRKQTQKTGTHTVKTYIFS